MAKHALLSASGSHRWLKCTPSARLEETLPEKTSNYAREGTIAHEIAEAYNDYTFKKTIKSKKALEKRLWPLQQDELYQPEMLDHADAFAKYVKERFNEVKAIDKDAYVCFEEMLDYSDFVPEGFGTGDAIIVSDAKLIILDFKYGKGVHVTAVGNTQMQLYALGAYQAFSYAYTLEEIEMVIYQPRLDNISTVIVETSKLLDWAENELKEKAALAFDGAGKFKPGEHCRFCRAKATCRALAEENLRLQQYEYKTGAQLTHKEIGDIIKISERLTNWAKDIKAYALQKALEGEKFEGFKVVAGRSIRKYKDEDECAKLLKGNGYTESDIYKQSLLTITAMEKLLTKKGFNELLGEQIIKPEGKPTLVSATDKRPEYSTAVSDFANVEAIN